MIDKPIIDPRDPSTHLDSDEVFAVSGDQYTLFYTGKGELVAVFSGPMHEATRNRFAAAKEMHEALRAVVAAGMVPSPGSVRSPEKIEATHIGAQVRAAIAKAEGGGA